MSGYRRLFDVITAEEEGERLAMRENLIRTFDTLVNLDAKTARKMAEAFVEYIDARHADARLLALEHHLGLVPEDTLLRAYRDASVTLGASAFTTMAARLGVGLTRLRPRDAIVTLRTAAARYDALLGMRRANVSSYIL